MSHPRSLVVLVSLALTACSGAGLPAESSSTGGQTSGQTGTTPVAGASCADGEVQACKLFETNDNGVVSCMSGVMTCAHGAFGACAPPPAPASEAAEGSAPTIFVATCDPPMVARWSHLTWQADLTAAESIRLSVQALPSPGAGGAPRPATPLQVADIGGADPASCTSASCGDITAALGDAAYASRLRVSAHVDHAKAAGGAALVDLAALFDCVAK
jgi:hypothetical protein